MVQVFILTQQVLPLQFFPSLCHMFMPVYHIYWIACTFLCCLIHVFSQLVGLGNMLQMFGCHSLMISLPGEKWFGRLEMKLLKSMEYLCAVIIEKMTCAWFGCMWFCSDVCFHLLHCDFVSHLFSVVMCGIYWFWLSVVTIILFCFQFYVWYILFLAFCCYYYIHFVLFSVVICDLYCYI